MVSILDILEFGVLVQGEVYCESLLYQQSSAAVIDSDIRTASECSPGRAFLERVLLSFLPSIEIFVRERNLFSQYLPIYIDVGAHTDCIIG